MPDIVNLIIQLIAGSVAGNAAGDLLKDYDLGPGNLIAGATGGVVGGQILQHLIPTLAGLDASSIVSQLVAAGTGGAMLTVIAGAVRNMRAGQ
jgi:uncharacterized membrane protein YeaQ/YmgE (transglycosylase-associated protein family)